MTSFGPNIKSRINKKFIYVPLVLSLIILAILPGIPLVKETLYGQQEASFPFRSSIFPVTQSPLQPEVRPARGKFLVASRQLKDPNFSQTVVLLLEYGRSGAMGLVINRPTEVKLSTVLPNMEGAQDLSDNLYIGGPVAKHQMMLLIRSGSQPEGSRLVFNGIYVSSSRTVLQKMIDDKETSKTFRLYAGHAGWSPGQLDREVARGGWHILRADAGTVFEKAPTEIWPELIDRSSALWVLHLKQGLNLIPYRKGVRL